ncbi:unnamed protein product [Caenorhabditis auriculariae]|uniref:Uncharacterized protein n=1 Tax=Caenorhabditis auriculariae TaxID=2777116 RepID=A0A8S1HL38_9PELO|nr:unnamed protein product [Caenorhabditis auriculariae]
MDQSFLQATHCNKSTPTLTSGEKKAGWAAFNNIRKVTSQLKDPQLRAQIFEASVIPALTYASEVWPDTKGTVTALRTS